MPVYSTSAFAPLPHSAISGTPAYFLGSFPTNTSDTLINVTNVSLTTNVATITGTILSGDIPAVGNLISLQGTQTASGAFNVSSVALTGVTVNAGTGTGTFTFALTHANVTSIADSGQAIVPIAEVAETLAANTSIAIYVASQEPQDLGSRSITVATTFPTMPTAATVTLQTAINNNPAEYTPMGVVATIASSAFTAGPLVTFTTPAGRFFRVVVSGITGSGTITCKMIC